MQHRWSGRCVKADIEAAAKALEPAGERARIHIFLATSKLHMQFKLKKAESEILRMAAEGVSYAKQFVQDVEFSPEDASRTDLDFLTKVVETVIDAGATTVNIPDTVGYTTPDEFYRIIRHLKENVPNIGKAVISVHCHNDLGLAVANSLQPSAPEPARWKEPLTASANAPETWLWKRSSWPCAPAPDNSETSRTTSTRRKSSALPASWPA